MNRPPIQGGCSGGGAPRSQNSAVVILGVAMSCKAMGSPWLAPLLCGLTVVAAQASPVGQDALPAHAASAASPMSAVLDGPEGKALSGLMPNPAATPARSAREAQTAAAARAALAASAAAAALTPAQAQIAGIKPRADQSSSRGTAVAGNAGEATVGEEVRTAIKENLAPETVSALKELRSDLGQIKNSLGLEKPDAAAREPKRVGYQGERAPGQPAQAEFGLPEAPPAAGSRLTNGQVLVLAEQLFYELLPWALGAMALYGSGSLVVAVLRMQVRKRQQQALRRARRSSGSSRFGAQGDSSLPSDLEPASIAAAPAAAPARAAALDVPIIRPQHRPHHHHHHSSGDSSLGAESRSSESSGRKVSSSRSGRSRRSGPYL